jgi:hypothetical protein
LTHLCQGELEMIYDEKLVLGKSQTELFPQNTQ